MNLTDLLHKPIWQMTGEEFLFLQKASDSEEPPRCPKTEMPTDKRYEYGIRGIAKVFGCSIPTANRIKKSGKIDRAITQVGRKIIIDAELALQLAQERAYNKRGGRAL